MLIGGRRTSRRTSGSSTSLGFVARRRRRFLWLQQTPSGQSGPRPVSCSRCPLVERHRALLGDRALCRILGAMSKAGVPIPEAMRAAIAAANNTVFEAKLQPAQERMLEGEGLAEPIAATELFPRAAVQMMRVGESTGTLDQQLENAAEYYAPRARLQAQEAHDAVRAGRDRLHGHRRRLRRHRARAGHVRHLQLRLDQQPLMMTPSPFRTPRRAGRLHAGRAARDDVDHGDRVHRDPRRDQRVLLVDARAPRVGRPRRGDADVRREAGRCGIRRTVRRRPPTTRCRYRRASPRRCRPKYWDGINPNPAVYGPTCPTPDKGAQQLTVTLTRTSDGQKDSLVIVKRDEVQP